eukprot:366252-Pyramimonas_sp.AAC.1
MGDICEFKHADDKGMGHICEFKHADDKGMGHMCEFKHADDKGMGHRCHRHLVSRSCHGSYRGLRRRLDRCDELIQVPTLLLSNLVHDVLSWVLTQCAVCDCSLLAFRTRVKQRSAAFQHIDGVHRVVGLQRPPLDLYSGCQHRNTGWRLATRPG